MTEIKNMTIADYEAVYQLWISTPGMGLNDLDDSREGIEKFLTRNPNTCFVAKEKGQMAGVIICGNDGRRGYIYHMAVAVKLRDRGIGSKLLEAALDALQEEGIKKAALVVFAENEIGNRFWEKRGFTTRTDLNYRNKALADLKRIDT